MVATTYFQKEFWIELNQFKWIFFRFLALSDLEFFIGVRFVKWLYIVNGMMNINKILTEHLY